MDYVQILCDLEDKNCLIIFGQLQEIQTIVIKATSSTNSAQCSAINSKVQIAHVSRGYVKYGNFMRKRGLLYVNQD